MYFFSNNESIKNEIESKGWKFYYIPFKLYDDNITSALQSKYIKFLQFLNDYPDFKKYKKILYFDHKVFIKKEHLTKLNSLANDKDFIPPSIVAGLAVRIPKGVMLPEATLIIDVALITKHENNYSIKVGEIKVFPDRGGHTDPGEISTARAQAGVYQHALTLTVQALNLSSPPKVDHLGFLVFLEQF